ncbi:hypothetical protein EVAR_84_1 [Eumeta japonica]|uniref:Reverse transcriptase domain-containing protein n=1 Tax=Eumeta variegata TaxID=151549 RepID=A0A4C1S882_EUMVA|nr:hypothetical protein EVAR_84_1 [Eumeta japonica]
MVTDGHGHPQPHRSRVRVAGLYLCTYLKTSRKDRCRSSYVRERCDLKEDVATRVKRGMFRWFGHLERMNERRLTEQIYRTKVCDRKVGKGSPRKFQADHVGGMLKKDQFLGTRNRRAGMKRLMDVSDAREICKDRTIWKFIVSAYPSGK